MLSARRARHRLRYPNHVYVPPVQLPWVAWCTRPLAPCCGLPCRPTYAESLAATNCAVRCLDRVDLGPIPFSTYLRATNAADRLAAEQARSGLPLPAPSAAPRPATPVAPRDAALPGLPRLGDVSPVRVEETVRHVEVAYQVRNLLSRGALIDLCG